MGSRPAFFTSWTLVLGYVSVVAFEAVALPQTLLYLFPDMLVGRLWSVAGYDVYASWVNAILFIGALSVVAPFFGRKTLVWLVDAGGLAIIVAWLMVALSFIILRRREPDMERPFRTPGGVPLGVLAVILAASLAFLFMPGQAAALVWPYEWAIVGSWTVLGVIFMAKLARVGPGVDAEHRLMEAMGRR